MRSLAFGLGALLGIGGLLVFLGLGALAALDGGAYTHLAFLVYGGAGGAVAIVGSILMVGARGLRPTVSEAVRATDEKHVG